MTQVLGRVLVPHTPDVNVGDDVRMLGDLATQKLAVLGISGSGKTYGAGKLVELLAAEGRQFCVIDTVGNWFGLRVAKDGKGPGLRVPVLGGDHGDVAIESGHGRLVAETLAETGSSMIVDISDFTGGETRAFVVAFATALLAAKKRSPSPLMVVWEECQEIVPQKVFGEDARMVGAVQKLIKKGRNYGVGTMLISQRAAAVNKEALNQCHTLLGFRVIGKLDRKAIEDWTTDHGEDAATTAMSKLDTGACVLWSPQWLRRRDVIKIAPKWTFDASATPDFDGHVAKVGKLAPVDLDKFKARMAEAIQKADERDPGRLQERIATLERELASRDTGAMRTRDVELAQKIDSENRLLRAEIQRLRLVCQGVQGMADGTVDAVHEHVGKIRAYIHHHTMANVFTHDVERPRAAEVSADAGRVAGVGHGDPGMSKLMRALLTVLAQNRSGLTKKKILAYANYAPSGAVSTCFSDMAKRDYMVGVAGKLVITKAGLDALGQYTPLPVGRAYYEFITRSMDALPRKLLAAIVSAYPRDITKRDVLEKAGYAPSGAVSTAFAWLASRDYIEKRGSSLVRASDHLFDERKTS